MPLPTRHFSLFTRHCRASGSAQAFAELAPWPAYAAALAFCHVDRKSCPERSRMGGDISRHCPQEMPRRNGERFLDCARNDKKRACSIRRPSCTVRARAEPIVRSKERRLPSRLQIQRRFGKRRFFDGAYGRWEAITRSARAFAKSVPRPAYATALVRESPASCAAVHRVLFPVCSFS